MKKVVSFSKIILLCCFAMVFSFASKSATTVPGGTVSGTWTLSGSPYNVQGSIQIANGTTLTIEPGVTVNFQGTYKLLVLGRLLAIGTTTDTISFTTDNTSLGWLGIRFDNTSATNDTSKIMFCKMQYGKATGTSLDIYGGALYFNYYSKCLISNCLISNCSATNGGGIYCMASDPIITNNTITNNSANNMGMGGAIYCQSGSPMFSNNIISYNSAIEGGGISSSGCSPIISNNTITNNVANSYGGGIECFGGSPVILNNIITLNTASTSYGGGIYIFDCNATVSANTVTHNTGNGGGGLYIETTDGSSTIINNIISNNSGSLQGGGIWCSQVSMMSNNIIANNYANSGGGIYFYNAKQTITNCDIVNNKAVNGGAIYCNQNSDPGFKNCILWGNNATSSGMQVFINDDGSDPSFNYSIVQGGSAAFGLNGNFYTGTYQNNLNSSPFFVSPSAGAGTSYNGTTADWSLQNTSPCIDAGDTIGGGYLTTDIAGNTRIAGCSIDIGAYENVYSVATNLTDKSLCVGENAFFSISPSCNDNVYYKWQHNGVDIANSNDNFLAINNVSLADSGNYCCIVFNTLSSDTSEFAHLTVNPLPVSNAGSNLTICSGEPGSIGTSSTLGYTYSWLPSSGLNDAAVSNPNITTINSTSSPIVTNYIVTTTISATGCRSNDTAIVTVNPQPILVINNPAPVCFPSTVNLTVSAVTTGSTGGGAKTYWLDSIATVPLSNPSAVAVSGTYYIVVTAIGGCTDTNAVNVLINPLPVSNAGSDLAICSGEPGTIGTSSTLGYTYSWSPSSGLSDATVSNPNITTINSTSSPIVTNYIVTTAISATGCYLKDTALVTVNPQPVLVINDPAPVCFPSTINITASAVTTGSTGGGTLSYWLDSIATVPLSNPSAVAVSGTYYIMTNAFGCTDTNTTNVIINALPVVGFTDINSFYCYNSPALTLVGNPLGGTFSGNTGISGNTFTPSIAGVGIKTITYNFTDNNGCSNSASQTTEVLSLPVAPAICMVTVDSTSTNNVIYWDKTIYTNVDSFIVYREITASDYERIGAVSMNSISMFIDTVRALYFPYTGDPNGGTYRYKLQIRDTCGNYSPLSLYHNTIFVTQNGGTFNWNDYKIEGSTIPIPELNSYILLRDDNSTGDWNVVSGVAGTQTTITDPDFASYPNASWRIITSWNINCNPSKNVVSSSLSNIKGHATGLSIHSIYNEIIIYPNPAENAFTIDIPSFSISDFINIELFDINGRSIKSSKIDEAKTTMNLGELPAGVYVIKISYNNQIAIKKLVKK